jgi:hypothetical protein
MGILRAVPTWQAVQPAAALTGLLVGLALGLAGAGGGRNRPVRQNAGSGRPAQQSTQDPAPRRAAPEYLDDGIESVTLHGTPPSGVPEGTRPQPTEMSAQAGRAGSAIAARAIRSIGTPDV